MKALISICFWVCIAATGYFGLYQPEQAQQANLTLTAENLERTNADLERRIFSLQAAHTEFDLPAEMFWRATSRSDAELSLQKATLDLAGARALSLAHFSTVPLSREVSREIVAFEIEGQSTLRAFYTFLIGLERQTPQVAIAAMRLRPTRGNDSDATELSIYFQLTVWGFWGEAS